MAEKRKWFALYTKPRREFKAAIQLEAISVESYLPTITKLKKWSDRKKKIEEPLFRGYIFIRADEKERLISLEQDAIIKTIFFDGRPAEIPEWQIESLKKMLESNADIFVSDKLEVGTEIVVKSGPFQGIKGVIIKNANKEDMLAVSIGLLNRSVMVNLPAADVEKVEKN